MQDVRNIIVNRYKKCLIMGIILLSQLEAS